MFYRRRSQPLTVGGQEGNEDGFIDLDSRDPRQINEDAYKVSVLPIMSVPGMFTPEWAILGEAAQRQTTR